MREIIFKFVVIFFISLGTLSAKVQVPGKIILDNQTDYFVGIENLEVVDQDGIKHDSTSGETVLNIEPKGRGRHDIPLDDGNKFAGSKNADKAHIVILSGIINHDEKEVSFGKQADGEADKSKISIINFFHKMLSIPDNKKEAFGNHQFFVEVTESSDEYVVYWAPVYIVTVTQK